MLIDFTKGMLRFSMFSSILYVKKLKYKLKSWSYYTALKVRNYVLFQWFRFTLRCLAKVFGKLLKFLLIFIRNIKFLEKNCYPDYLWAMYYKGNMIYKRKRTYYY